VRQAVLWSADAADDVEAVAVYIAQDNPAAAHAVVDAIEETAERLSEMATGHPGRVGGTYEKVVPRLPYIIAYALHTLPEGGEAVVILRVIHGARNWPPDEWPK
jgi:plasmid stabilization system protein ParE